MTFNTNGGTSIASQTIASGSTATKPSNPKRSGYTFVNWYKESTFKNVFDFSTAITSNITIYAKWKFSNSGGSSSSGGGGGSGYISSIKTDNLSVKDEENLKTANDINSSVNIVSINKDATTTTKINTNEVKIDWSKDDQTGKWKMEYSSSNENSGARSAYGFLDVVNVVSNVNPQTNLTETKTTISTYYFEETSLMHIGWLTTADTKTYFFNTLKTASANEEGKMAIGWKDIEKKWYYFDGEGVLLKATTTPDGYNVDANGVWVE